MLFKSKQVRDKTSTALKYANDRSIERSSKEKQQDL
jgi:hypothetical protein